MSIRSLTFQAIIQAAIRENTCVDLVRIILSEDISEDNTKIPGAC
jgi:hypothetical protein